MADETKGPAATPKGPQNIPVHGPGAQQVAPKTANPDQQVNPPQHPQQNRQPGQQPNVAKPEQPPGAQGYPGFGHEEPVAKDKAATPQTKEQDASGHNLPEPSDAAKTAPPSPDREEQPGRGEQRQDDPKAPAPVTATPARANTPGKSPPAPDIRPLSAPKTFRVGDVYNVVVPEHTGGELQEGRQKARIVAITAESGKPVGIEFADPIGIHSCDGNGKDGHCLWVRFDQVLSDDEYAAHKAERGARGIKPQAELFDEVQVTSDDRGNFKTNFVKGKGGLGPNVAAGAQPAKTPQPTR